MTVIVFDRVTKRFGDRIVLDDLDLQVREGEFLTVIGRSGTGKSTLLRIIAGLESPTGGHVTAPAEIAFAFQEPRLLPWLSVRENVGFGLPRGTRDAIAEAALAEVGLADRADAWPLTLSGGQAQRVSLARALVHRPRLLLLDEPFGALDALTRLDMQNLVGRLRDAHGWTVVLVTHDVHEAARLADRVIVLEHGRVHDEITIPGHGPRPPEGATQVSVTTSLLRSLGVQTETAAPTVHPPTLLVESR